MTACTHEYSPALDPGIRRYVELLNAAGVETFESCEGGEGHSYFEPTIRFHGDIGEGWRALGIALGSYLPVDALRQIWLIVDGRPSGPHWEMTFSRKA